MKANGSKIALCGLYLALFTISAKIQIPTPLIPFTLLTACFLLCIFTLDGFAPFFTVGAYIFAGLIGLPLFASGGGFSYLLNPSFGYLLGFLIASLIKCLLVKKKLTDYKQLLLFSLLFLLVVHLAGNLYVYIILTAHLSVKITLFQSFITNGLLFIPIDIIWAFVCPAVIKRLNA